MFNNFFPENHTIYVIQWENVIEPDTAETTI